MKTNLISIIGIIIGSFIGSALAAPVTQLTLVKEVIGGEATVTDWELTADGTDTNDLIGDGWISGLVDPDTFLLSESVGPPGYTAGDWNCVGGGSLDGQSLTLLEGDVVTCTIINTYVPPVVVFDTDFALPSMPVGDGAGTPVCVDDASGLLVVGCDAAGDITAVTAGTGLTGGGVSGSVSLSVGTGAITAAHLAINSVGADKIAADAVGQSEIATSGVASTEVLDDSLTASDLAANSVGISELNTSAILEPSGNTYSSSGAVVTNSNTTVISKNFTPPTAGTVLVVASGSYSCGNCTSSNTYVGMFLTITTSSTGSASSGDYVVLQRNYNSAGNTHTDLGSFTINNVFSVSGATSFYVRGQTGASGDEMIIKHAQLSMIFIPN